MGLCGMLQGGYCFLVCGRDPYRGRYGARFLRVEIDRLQREGLGLCHHYRLRLLIENGGRGPFELQWTRQPDYTISSPQ
jgi:hypothetical protein